MARRPTHDMLTHSEFKTILELILHTAAYNDVYNNYRMFLKKINDVACYLPVCLSHHPLGVVKQDLSGAFFRSYY